MLTNDIVSFEQLVPGFNEISIDGKSRGVGGVWGQCAEFIECGFRAISLSCTVFIRL